MRIGPRAAAVGVALGLLVSACADTGPSATNPWCDDFSVLVLEAQSVPTAQLVPCLEVMPLGWNVFGARIDDTGTMFTLDSDIAGERAVEVRLVPACDVEGYVRVPTDEAETERYEFVEDVAGGFRGQRAYLFDGGCVTMDFRFRVEASAALVNEASLAVSLMPRSTIDAGIREATDGRERLDPPAGG